MSTQGSNKVNLSMSVSADGIVTRTRTIRSASAGSSCTGGTSMTGPRAADTPSTGR